MIIIDTGVLYALADRTDRHHGACVSWLQEARGTLLVPPTVLAEAGYLIGAWGGNKAEAEFLASVGSAGRFTLTDLVSSDVLRMRELIARYADLRIGTTDASLIAIAERLGIVDVATIDRRHFTVVRPNHTESFTLLP
jgi:uncharacterized protein